MHRRLYPLLIALSVLVPVETIAAADLEEDFETGTLDRNRWCPCQINEQKAPVTFSDDPGDAKDRIAPITVDENSLGGNECRQEAPHFECGAPAAGVMLMDETAETQASDFLGPSFMAVTKPQWQPTPDRPDPYCNEEILERVKNGDEERLCIQRQELRLVRQFTHDAAKPHLYSLRFRMPKDVGDKTNSIRWVTAQWKQEPVSDEYKKEFGDDWGASPFLAQRFDNGVLHITVQDEIAAVWSRPRLISTARCFNGTAARRNIASRPGPKTRKEKDVRPTSGWSMGETPCCPLPRPTG